MLNPLMIATILLISTLLILDIPTEKFNQGAGFINLFLPPVTVMLALPIYKQLAILKKNLLPILIGAATGSLTAIISVFILSHIFGFDQSILISLLPKSVTTPIGLELSSQLGGIPSITIFAILITGILSAILSPLLIKIFRIKNKIAAGLAIGTSGHALGTT
ncbi:MAG: LrgB family protein, partial [Clostridiales bacterium]